MNFYGTRAGGKHNHRDVYPKAYRSYQTDKAGKVEISNLYKFYHPDLTDPNVPPKEPQDLFPYSCWFSFVIEVIDGNERKYAWLTATEVQREFMETGNTTYELKVSF